MANMTLNSFGIANGNTVETLTSLDGKLVLSSDMGTAISFTKVAPTFSVGGVGSVFTAVGKADGKYLISGKLVFVNTKVGEPDVITNDICNFEMVAVVDTEEVTELSKILTLSNAGTVVAAISSDDTAIELTADELTSVIAYSCSVIKL